MQRFRNFRSSSWAWFRVGRPVLAAASDAVTGLWRDDGSILWVNE